MSRIIHSNQVRYGRADHQRVTVRHGKIHAGRDVERRGETSLPDKKQAVFPVFRATGPEHGGTLSRGDFVLESEEGIRIHAQAGRTLEQGIRHHSRRCMKQERQPAVPMGFERADL